MDLMGNDALQSEDDMRLMWGDSTRAVKCPSARITFDDFLLLMKGQTRENPPIDYRSDHVTKQDTLKNVEQHIPAPVLPRTTDSAMSTLSADQRKFINVEPNRSSWDAPPSMDDAMPVHGSPTRSTSSASGQQHMTAPALPRITDSAMSTISANQTKFIDFEPNLSSMDAPLSMDDAMPVHRSLTPPKNSASERQDDKFSPYEPPESSVLVPLKIAQRKNLETPSFPRTPLVRYSTRRRSQSLQERKIKEGSTDYSDITEDPPLSVEVPKDPPREDLHAVADVVRELILPEADHYGAQVPPELEEIVKDKTKSALVVNRRLYRAHRQMRMAVLDASKRFEEQQAQHACDLVLAQSKQQDQAEEDPNCSNSGSSGATQAGLVMRRSYHSKQVSGRSVRALLARGRAEQQTLVEKATRLGGRGRGSRKKTISDVMQSLQNIDKGSSSTFPEAKDSSLVCECDES